MKGQGKEGRKEGRTNTHQITFLPRQTERKPCKKATFFWLLKISIKEEGGGILPRYSGEGRVRKRKVKVVSLWPNDF